MFDAGVLTVLTWIGAVALGVYLVILAVKFYLSCNYFLADSPACGLARDVSVTVVQPILSGDPFLEQALRGNLEQTPSWARFLWLIDEDDPTGLSLAQRLCQEAGSRVRVLQCPPAADNVNPKTYKLQHALAHVDTSYVAVLDDDTMLADRNLERAVSALESCDLYTGLPCYLPGTNFWSSLVSHFVNNNSILTYLPLLAFTEPLTINGMFYVMRTDWLRSIGGFTSILNQLCDDFALGNLVKKHGGVIRQGTTPQFLRTTVDGPGHYTQLMRRWFVFADVLVRAQPFRILALLFVLLGLPPFLLWLGLLTLCGGWPWALLVLAVLLTRHLALRRLHRLVFGGVAGFSWAMSLLAELLQPLHWLHSLMGGTLRWRSRNIRVRRDGTFSYVTGDGQ